ncbi:Histone-arginine methyltransferase METTL23-like protein [Drosera capensis]
MPRAAAATSFAGESTVKSTTDDLMSTISVHSFGESETESDNFTIHIIENIREEYGMFVWPCAVVLAEYVWQQRDRFRGGVNVLEIGAGTALPGLVAARVGADVTLSDDSEKLEVLENIRSVCDLNKLDCQVAGIQWGVWDEYMFDCHPKIILGADVLYDSSAFDNLFSTVTFLLQNSPGSVFITTYHNRSGHHLIEFLMVKWGLKCIKLIDGFSFIPPHKASRLGGNIQLAEIALCQQ